MSFTIYQNEKTPFQAIKTRSSKRRNIDIFPKGLTHGFSPKMAIFPTFFLGNIGQENVFYDILERKSDFLVYKDKNGHFPTFFSRQQGQENVIKIFQNEKTPFQAIKKTSSKSPKIDIFSKGLTNGFGPNMASFPTYFLGNIGKENVFYDLSRTKKRLSTL